ncbi:acyltransferase [Hymenobacter sp. BRD128]|uniref:acyltransferase family protein n=1 Tax=Hymenobacter sp. BRD128 TaxID=2675878 RepID=UPI001564ABD9|nr:acyltransferase [Hymenobacter sp. BRD128]QKG55510.1 acyltransferase [Hymenobacter sp. BRD128]
MINSITAPVNSTKSPEVLARGRVFFPNLDGLRFFAFLSVFLFHSFYTPYSAVSQSAVYKVFYNLTRPGHLGVNFFFVLSGFLITYLLLSERALTGRIAIGAFYMRRILRIWPLYYLIVLLGFVIYPWAKVHFGQHGYHETAQVGYFLVFLSNFNNLYHGSETPTLTLLWSVSVEEQFYVVWPLLVAIVPTRRLGWLFGGVIMLSLVFRALHWNEPLVLGFHTLGLIGDMALGGLTAWLCFRDERLTSAVARLPRWAIVLTYMAGITLCYYTYSLSAVPGYSVIERLLLGLFFAFVLLEQNYAQHSVVKMTQLRFPTYWGTYTYGLYCLHYLALLLGIYLMTRLGLNTTPLGVILGDNLLGLAIALFVSWVSFTYYEKPFLKLKNRFAFITK